MTDHTLDASVAINFQGNLERQAKRYEQALGNMSRNGSRHMNRLQRTTRSLDNAVSRMGNRWVALATGGALTVAAKKVATLEERIERLGVQSNSSTQRMERLKKKIFEVSNQSDIRIDSTELLSSVEEIIEKTGDLDFAIANLDNFSMAISATGARGQAIGGIAAEFQKMGIVTKREVREALDILITQGKEGAFTLQNLAELGPRVVTAYTSMGREGVPAIREMGAALQVIRMATGSSEQAATSFEALMRTFSDAKKVGMLQSAGIQVFDAAALKRGEEILRPIDKLLVDIIRVSGGKKTVLSNVFDSEALRSFNQALTEYRTNGEVSSLQKFMDLQADGNNLLKDSSRIAQTANGSMRMLTNSAEQFADLHLAGPIEDLADAINSLNNQDLMETLEIAKDAVLTLGMMGIGYKVARAGQGMFQRGKGALRGGNAVNGASMASPMPVYVVNAGAMGMGGVGGMGPDGSLGKGGKAGKIGWGSKLLARGGMLMGAAGGIAGAGMIGYSAGSFLNEHFISGTGVSDWIGEKVAQTLALFGNETARQALEANTKVELELAPDAAKLLNPKSVEGKHVSVSGTVTAMEGM